MALKPYNQLKTLRLRRIKCPICGDFFMSDQRSTKVVKVGGRQLEVCSIHPVEEDKE